MLELNEIYCGDNVELLKQIDENSVDLVVTSPPYDDLRDYQGYSFDFKGVSSELYRVMKPGGVVVWVVGDSTINKSESGNSLRQALEFIDLGFKLHDTMIYEKNGSSFPSRRDGNRYSQIFEYMFIFSKDDKPTTANLICDKENRWAGHTSFGKSTMRNKDGNLIERHMKPVPNFSPRNNIWKYNTGKNYSTKDKEAFLHPAIFPEQLVDDHIKSWSNKGDLVLDPFSGSGTTSKMAKLNNRNHIGIDISENYCSIARKRLGIVKNNKLINFFEG